MILYLKVVWKRNIYVSSPLLGVGILQLHIHPSKRVRIKFKGIRYKRILIGGMAENYG